MFLCCHESMLYTFEATTTHGNEESFNLVHGPRFKIIAAFRALVDSFLEDIGNYGFRSEMYTMVAQHERHSRTTIDQRLSLGIWFLRRAREG